MRARWIATSALQLATKLAALLVSGAALAEQYEAAPDSGSVWRDSVRRATRAGSYLPLTLPPDAVTSAATGAAQSGYDGARRQALVSIALQARVIGPLALRVGAAQARGGRFAPSVGTRAQLLTQNHYGLDLAASFFYKAEGFTEMEGELETALSVGRRFDRLALFSMFAYGQDGEGHERDAEVSLACLFDLSSTLVLGLDSRVRFDAGSDRRKLRQNGEPLVDLSAGPLLALVVGPVALSAQTGFASFWSADRRNRTGIVALGGIGTSF